MATTPRRNTPIIRSFQGGINAGFGPVGRAANAKHGIAKAAQTGVNPYSEIGRTGLRQWGGYVLEEWLSELQGRRGAEMYREMQDQDPIIGGMMFCAEMLVRKVTWNVEPASSSQRADQEAADFLGGVLFDDLEHTWADVITEILSMLGYGYHIAEVVYKRRNGESRDRSKSSKFTDGKVGLAKLATRSQDSLLHWDFDPDTDEWSAFVQQPPPTYTTYTIPREKALLFRTKVHKQNPEGYSLLRRCVRPYYFKKNFENLRGIGVERDLAGLPLLQAPPDVDIWNTNDAAMVQLLSQAQAFVTQVRRDELEGVVIPNGWEFSLLKAAGDRQIDVNQAINYYDQRMAMSMVADMITLGADKVGSYALAGAKKDLFSAALEAFLDSIGAVFNTFLIPRLFKMNGWQGITDYPKLAHGNVQDIDLETVAALLTAMGHAGAPVFSGDTEDALLNALLGKMGLPSVAADDTSENE